MLTEGQHRPKAGKKKKTREAGLFFLVPTEPRCFIRKWVKKPFPRLVLDLQIPNSIGSWPKAIRREASIARAIARSEFRPIVGVGS